MQDKEARDVLGVKQDAGREEIIKRYEMLLKKHKSGQEIGNGLEEINRAYDFLMGYGSKDDAGGDAGGEKPFLPGALLKRLNIDEKRADNFIYYHKYHIVLGILAVCLLAYFVKGCVSRVNPDFNMAFIGEYYLENTDVLRSRIKSASIGIAEPGIDVVTVSEKSAGEQAYAMQMKAVVLVTAGEIDLFIMDRTNYEKYAKQGAFLNLDSIAGSMGIDRNSDSGGMPVMDETKETHIYGVKLDRSTIMNEINLRGSSEKIAAIRVNTKNLDKAVSVIKFLEQ